MKNTIIKSVFALALACSGASCTGNYLEINSNPYEVTEDEMQRKGYAISSYLNAIFGTIISPVTWVTGSGRSLVLLMNHLDTILFLSVFVSDLSG